MNRPVVLVTGSAQRIGAAVARYFHTQGYCVMVHADRSRVQAKLLVDELNGRETDSADVVFADLSEMTASKELVMSTVNRFGQLDVLINNASLFMPTPIAETTQAQWSQIFDVNLKACFFLCQQALPYLEQTKGAVVNITDLHARIAKPLYSLYSMSKAGLLSMTKALAHEFAPKVRVNAVAPGHVLSPCIDGIVKPHLDESFASSRPTVVMEDLVSTIYLAATNTSISGQELSVFFDV